MITKKVLDKALVICQVKYMDPRRIRVIRSVLELTQHEMAVAIGVSRNAFSSWERGKAKPHPVFVAKMKELEQTAREKQKVEAL